MTKFTGDRLSLHFFARLLILGSYRVSPGFIVRSLALWQSLAL